MSEFIEVHAPAGIDLKVLAGERMSLGRDDTNDVSIEWDPMVSRRHAVLDRYASGWSIRDLGSSNGTFVNRKKIWAEQALHSGDEILVGNTILSYRGEIAPGSETIQAAAPPKITQREREVLISLCRPLLRGDPFPEPASVEQIAGELFVSQPAVRQHLGSLYDKFAIDEGDGRRGRLANEAVRRRAIGTTDLADPPA